ncbi:outer membrane protein assembly factor BamB family protein [Asticcacaulis solisilvae]|uniref:outer membrane protein assembly factor BamB family protein n=1 Tax=Asticcacaulis solisilvae TaxID=1217274 RepID=UPI003FD8FB96
MTRQGGLRLIGAVAIAALLLAGCSQRRPIDATSDASGADWPWYHGNPHGTHYSTLDQITTANVKGLKVAWTFDSGDAVGEGGNQSDMEGNPMIVRERLYFVSPKGRLFCLDAATGKRIWLFDPSFGDVIATKQRLRGVSYWSGGADERILFTFKGKLMAVDAVTGRLAAGFGHDGAVDLAEGLGRDPQSVSVGNVSPGVVYKDLIIMGSTGNTPGHIRAYDVRTGALKWTFHTIPQPGESGYGTWPKDAWKTAMGANAWSGLTLDPEHGLVFAPLASAGMGAKDFYGGDRTGDNLFGTSLVALDANTGKRVWHFQLVRHDVWDRDPPTPPTLITVKRGGKAIPAVAQTTKAGVVFILDRLTGQPLYPLKTLHPPMSDVPGEVTSATQVLPASPDPFARQQLTAGLLTNRTPEAHAAVARTFASLRSRGPFDPPSVEGTILLPGMDGGAEWGGAAYDPDTGVLYINANEMAWVLKVRKQPPKMAGASGEALYQNTCASCHGPDRKGSPPEFPSLIDVTRRLTAAQIDTQITRGGGRMPGFGQMPAADKAAIIGYLGNDPAQKVQKTAGESPSTDNDPYVFGGYNRFLDPDGYPAIAPPWGTLSALDVNTGRYVWKQPLGYYPELKDHATGSENYGGAVVTRGGVLFIAATVYDNQFRAFDKTTGKLLWQTTLPAAGIATPATYAVHGKQYVVIGAGGGKNAKGKPGGSIIAYSLGN